MTERRRDNMIKGIILPVVVAIITGVSASYLTVYVTLAVLENRVSYVERDIVSIKDILVSVNGTQTELARRGEWMLYQERRVEAIERAIDVLAKNANK